jgi:ribosome-associated translation inhibitor RaiA
MRRAPRSLVKRDTKASKEQDMSVIINTEDFSLSMAARESVEAILEKLEPILTEGVQIRLFLKKAPQDLLTAILKVHVRGKDFVATKTGDDLEGLVLAVETQLRKRIVELNHKRVHLRRGKSVAS